MHFSRFKTLRTKYALHFCSVVLGVTKGTERFQFIIQVSNRCLTLEFKTLSKLWAIKFRSHVSPTKALVTYVGKTQILVGLDTNMGRSYLAN